MEDGGKLLGNWGQQWDVQYLGCIPHSTPPLHIDDCISESFRGISIIRIERQNIYGEEKEDRWIRWLGYNDAGLEYAKITIKSGGIRHQLVRLIPDFPAIRKEEQVPHAVADHTT